MESSLDVYWFRRQRSGETYSADKSHSLNLTEDFWKSANQLCPSITTLFQKSDVILSETTITHKMFETNSSFHVK